MAAFRHKTIWEPDWRNASEAAVAVTTHERIRLCVLSPLYLMVMDKLSVAYHLTLGLGVWCFSRVTVCWVDRFGLLIAVWWFWYVGCVEQVKSFMQWRLQIAFSCPSTPHPTTTITLAVHLMFGSINRKSLSSYTCSFLLPTEPNSLFLHCASFKSHFLNTE